ncbi:MAG: sulfoxide reductase heme-binding subunit YedZ [Gammaproteobacteria bacterium]|nr:sulfoxide reductase heme-binding subunit YedZ [Gammaproteobacteria bacterium]
MTRSKALLFITASIPALTLFTGLLLGRLGANPVEVLTHQTGEWGLRILLLTLAITPFRKLTGLHQVVRFRRMLGLFSFFYISLHFLTYVLLDAGLDLAYIAEDVLDRLYITAGFAGLCLMIPLAATSTNGMIKRLGGKNWQRLHRLTYLAAIAGVLHFLWLVKADLREPLVYTAILALLLVLRVPVVSARLGSWRGARRAARSRVRQPPASNSQAPARPEGTRAREPAAS